MSALVAREPRSVGITVEMRNGEQCEIAAMCGQSLMLALRAEDSAEVLALCGGACSCSTCHIVLSDEGLALLGEARGDEADLLDGSSHRSPNSRLSCQIEVGPELEGLRITIAPED